MRRSRPRRSLAQGVAWWWNTRVRSWWTVRLPAARRQARAVGTPWRWDQPGGDLPIVSPGEVTVILTRYKRGEYLQAQIDALRAQTHPPAEIWLWSNHAGDRPADDVSGQLDRVVLSDSNFSFWGRFALGHLARTPYVAFFDDDILPQPAWLQNCLEQYERGVEGILGGSGVILPRQGGYSSTHKVGWNGHHHDSLTPVDLVGHAWFLKREYLRFMWAEPPPSWENGEDIHLSAMAFKHGGLGTWVPPHPESAPERWSCRPDFGKSVGRTSNATFKSQAHHSARDRVVDHHRANGWQLVCERDPR